MAQSQDPQVVPRRAENFTTQEATFGKRGKFNVSVFQYPSDLHNQDLLHYVEFAINVRGKSKYDTGSKRLFSVAPTSDAKLSPEGISAVATGGTAVAAGVVAGALVGGVVNKFLSKFGKTGAVPGNSKTLGTTQAADKAISTGAGLVGGAVAAGATAAFVNANSMTKPDTSYRISDVINLHVDGPPTVKYSMNYANKELGTLAGIVGTGFGEGSMKSLSGAGEAAAAALTSFAKLPGAFGSVDVQSALSASAKTSLNPFKEVIFESVDFRSFAFKYKFFPKSKSESESVRSIIELFKFHMHPEMSDSKLFFIYPAEFQITYYFGSSENEYVHRFAPCVLESMEVSYGGEQFSTFADGSPTEINMSLIFRETEIITKKMLAEQEGQGGY